MVEVGIEIQLGESPNLSNFLRHFPEFLPRLGDKDAAQFLGIFDALKNKVGTIDNILDEAAEKHLIPKVLGSSNSAHASVK